MGWVVCEYLGTIKRRPTLSEKIGPTHPTSIERIDEAHRYYNACERGERLTVYAHEIKPLDGVICNSQCLCLMCMAAKRARIGRAGR